jgi:MFS family permease
VSFSAYGRLLRLPGIARLLIVSVFARLPHAASGLVFSLHVVNTLNEDFLHAGLASMVLTAGIALGSPWRGRVIDRSGLRRALAPSVAVTAAGWCAAPFASYGLLLGLCLVLGFFMLPVFPVVRQALAVLSPPEDRLTAFALDSVVTELIFVGAPILGVLLVTEYSSKAALRSIGVATAGAGALLMWFNPPMQSRRPVAGGTGGGRRPGRLLTGSLIAVLGATVAATFTFTGVELGIVAELKSWGESGSSGLVMAIWAGGSALGGLGFGALRRAAHPLWMVLGLAVVTAPAALASGVGALSALVFVAGLACAPAMASINGSLSHVVPEGRLGEALGWNGTALTAGAALGAPICGWAIDAFGPGGAFLAAAILGVVVSGAGLAIYRSGPSAD